MSVLEGLLLFSVGFTLVAAPLVFLCFKLIDFVHGRRTNRRAG